MHHHHSSDGPQDNYRYRPDEMAQLEERYTLRPVDVDTIRERVADDQQLVTTDVPGYLQSGLAPDVGTATGLYRLVQLFGTPNVPGLEAGGDQPDREFTTWQYLFEVTYIPADGDDDDERRALLSVYDYKTDLSVGVSEWTTPDDGPDRIALEPSPDPLPSGETPDDDTLEEFVQVVLGSIEHAVEATYQGLHV